LVQWLLRSDELVAIAVACRYGLLVVHRIRVRLNERQEIQLLNTEQGKIMHSTALNILKQKNRKDGYVYQVHTCMVFQNNQGLMEVGKGSLPLKVNARQTVVSLAREKVSMIFFSIST